MRAHTITRSFPIAVEDDERLFDWSYRLRTNRSELLRRAVKEFLDRLDDERERG